MNNTKLNIKDWAEADRPREKMLLKGVSALSDAELIAILIGSGNREETAVELSRKILYSVSNNLNSLAKLNIDDLQNFKGIGEAKAITILAAMELGRRRKLAEAMQVPQIATSRDVFKLFHPLLADMKHEELWLLLINQSNKVIRNTQLSKGGLSSSTADIRLIMKEAIESLAAGIILCHNHPSGSPHPSKEDDMLTHKLREAGKTMDIQLLDHVIICDNSYYSYKDQNKL